MATSKGSGTVDEAVLARLGLDAGMVVQEFGFDDDVSQPLRSAIAEATGEAIVDEEYGDVTDAVLVWFRDGDDDLADLLMDVQSLLDSGGNVWLLTPKAGREGHVPPRDVEEASSLAGLHATSSIVIDAAWTATQLVEKGQMR